MVVISNEILINADKISMVAIWVETALLTAFLIVVYSVDQFINWYATYSIAASQNYAHAADKNTNFYLDL